MAVSFKDSTIDYFSLLVCIYRDGQYTVVQLVIAHISASTELASLERAAKLL